MQPWNWGHCEYNLKPINENDKVINVLKFALKNSVLSGKMYHFDLFLFAVPHQQAVHHVFRESHEQQWEGGGWGRCSSLRPGDHPGGRKDVQHTGTETLHQTTLIYGSHTHRPLSHFCFENNFCCRLYQCSGHSTGLAWFIDRLSSQHNNLIKILSSKSVCAILHIWPPKVWPPLLKKCKNICKQHITLKSTRIR